MILGSTVHLAPLRVLPRRSLPTEQGVRRDKGGKDRDERPGGKLKERKREREREKEIKYGIIRRKRRRTGRAEERLTSDKRKQGRKARKRIDRVSSRSSSHFGGAFCAAAANYLITSDHW